MSATRDSTLHDPKAIIIDLQRQLADVQRTLDERTAERDATQRRLAERTAERDEALAREAATTEVLQVINSSPGDLAPVFDAMLEKALRLCDGVQGSLLTFDGGRPRLAVARGLSAEFVEVLREEWERRGPSEHHPMSRLMRGERVVQILDLSVSDLYRTGDATAVAGVQLGSVRTLMFVALVKDDAPVGAFIIARREVRAFSDKQIALVQNFVAQAVIAIENARLLTETREALEQQTATAEVLQVINRSPGELAPVFDAVLEKALSLCEASFGSVYTRNGEHFERAVSRGVPAEYLAAVPSVTGPFLPGGLFDRIISGESVISIPDLAEPVVIRLTPRFEPLVRLAGAHSYVGVALRKDEQLLGLIAIYRREVRPLPTSRSP